MTTQFTMSFRRRALQALIVGASMILMACTAGSENSTGPLPPLREAREDLVVGADHHIHIQSAAAINAIGELADLMPPEFRRSMETLPPVDADDIISELDAAGINRAAVLSAAFLLEMPEAHEVWTSEERRAAVVAENDYAAEQVGLYPERLLLFCGINPLVDYALEEVTRCHDVLGARGVKIHLPTSNVDLRNGEHLQQLDSVFQHAARLGMPVLIHMATRDPNFGAQDVENFIGAVVVGNENLELYLLHMAGWGSSGSQPHTALQAWISALNGGILTGRHGVYFETSGSYTRRIDNVRLAEQIEELGAERIYFGSDWPAILRPVYSTQNFWTHLPLDEDIIVDVLDNRASFFED